MVISTCSVCGETFLSKRKSTVCADKSTCRVKKSRADKKAKREAEKMMIPLEQFTLWEKVTMANPAIGSALNQMLKLHGKEAFALMLNSMVYVMKVEI
jgi:N-acetyl-beta-hexosaminidase